MTRPVLTLVVSEAAARALQALALIVLARKVTPADLSGFGLANSILAYLLLLILPALDIVAVRRAARGDLAPGTAAGWMVQLRLKLAGVAVVLAAAYGAFTGDWLLSIFSLAAVGGAASPKWVLQSMEASASLGAASVLAQAVFLAGVLFAPGDRLGWMAGAQAAGEVAAALWCWFASRRLGAPVAFDAAHPGPAERRALLSDAWPLQLSLLLGVMMYNFDVLMLGWFGKRAEIAFYLAAYRFITVFSPLFAAIQTAIYPRFVKAFPDFNRVRGDAFRLAAVLALGGLFVSVVLVFAGQAVLGILYGAPYEAAQPILATLAWVLPIQGARVIARQVALAWELQATDPVRALAAVLVNVGADFALVPRFGALGAAWSTLAAETTLLLLTVWAVRRRV